MISFSIEHNITLNIHYWHKLEEVGCYIYSGGLAFENLNFIVSFLTTTPKGSL